jgi:hypothetical protein
MAAVAAVAVVADGSQQSNACAVRPWSCQPEPRGSLRTQRTHVACAVPGGTAINSCALVAMTNELRDTGA